MVFCAHPLGQLGLVMFVKHTHRLTNIFCNVLLVKRYNNKRNVLTAQLEQHWTLCLYCATIDNTKYDEIFAVCIATIGQHKKQYWSGIFANKVFRKSTQRKSM